MPHEPVMPRSDRAYEAVFGKFREPLRRKNHVYVLVRVRVVVIIVRYRKPACGSRGRYDPETRVPFRVLHVERSISFDMDSGGGYYGGIGGLKASLETSPRNVVENK